MALAAASEACITDGVGQEALADLGQHRVLLVTRSREHDLPRLAHRELCATSICGNPAPPASIRPENASSVRSAATLKSSLPVMRARRSSASAITELPEGSAPS